MAKQDMDRAQQSNTKTVTVPSDLLVLAVSIHRAITNCLRHLDKIEILSGDADEDELEEIYPQVGKYMLNLGQFLGKKVCEYVGDRDIAERLMQDFAKDLDKLEDVPVTIAREEEPAPIGIVELSEKSIRELLENEETRAFALAVLRAIQENENH